jgi:hypothetical protein
MGADAEPPTTSGTGLVVGTAGDAGDESRVPAGASLTQELKMSTSPIRRRSRDLVRPLNNPGRSVETRIISSQNRQIAGLDTRRQERSPSPSG